MTPSVSIIIPCRNEEQFIDRLLSDLLLQDIGTQNMEVLLMDGMSTDGTREKISAFSSQHPFVRLIDNVHYTVPFALNLGIKSATAEIIMIMGAHSRFPEYYVSALVNALKETGADNVGGIMQTMPANESAQARAIALAMSSPVGVGNAFFRIGASTQREVDTVPFGCYRKNVFDRLGFFDTALTRNQDDELNARLKNAGGKIILIPSIKFQYFARPTVAKAARMYYQYGLFKPLVILKLGRPATIRQFAPPALALLFGILLLASVLSNTGLLLLIAAACSYMLAMYIAALNIAGNDLMLAHWLAWTFPAIHFSYGGGYLTGIFRFMIMGKHKTHDAPTLKTSR